MVRAGVGREVAPSPLEQMLELGGLASGLAPCIRSCPSCRYDPSPLKNHYRF